MDNDQRERRDWPASDGPTEAADEATRPADEDGAPSEQPPPPGEPAAEPPSEAAEPPAPDWRATEPPAARERQSEGWPSQDATPSAGAAPSDAWPTTPPEGGDEAAVEPALEPPSQHEPSWPSEPTPAAAEAAPPAEPPAGEAAWPGAEQPQEPPPGEVEAHPAAGTPGPDAGAAATVAAAGAAAHGVPDAEAAVTGESTMCPRCGTENRPGLAFCRNCGQRLVAAGVATTVERPGAPEGTQACPRCGTHNRAGVAFCQNCGANLRGAAPGYVPPTVAAEAEVRAEPVERGGAILGPVVLLIGLVGLITGYLLPFQYGSDSLFDRAFGSGGYGAAFWAGYPEVEAGLADQAYFGLAGPIPLLGVVLLILAVAGFVRARPGGLQMVGLIIALAWAVGLAVLFLLVEVGGNWGGDIVGLLRNLTPAGIIFFLASLIVIIGTLTRFGRS